MKEAVNQAQNIVSLKAVMRYKKNSENFPRERNIKYPRPVSHVIRDIKGAYPNSKKKKLNQDKAALDTLEWHINHNPFIITVEPADVVYIFFSHINSYHVQIRKVNVSLAFQLRF